MGFFDWVQNRFGPKAAVAAVNEDDIDKTITASLVAGEDESLTMTFDNTVMTYRGKINNLDYEAILRDKERHIYKQFSQSDYYIDADPLYRGIIKQVYVPFSIADPWKLVGSNDETKRKYERFYKELRLKDKMESIFYQYFKYANVYTYLFNDGRLITLPPDMVRVASVAVGNEPLLEFDCLQALQNIGMQRTTPSAENYLKDSEIEVRLRGYPPEVAETIRSKKNFHWCQLNPQNTFTMQDTKEDWMRYAIPQIASCLMALKKKAIISDWEDASLKLGTRAFLHVKYGDPDGEVLPNVQQLSKVYQTFKKAMQGTALAVTNHWADCDFKQPDLDEIFHYDKYNSVNQQILSAGGISDIVVSGQATGGATFATAQVSMQTAAVRIRRARDRFCEMMDRINQRINERGFGGVSHSAPDQIPRFTFPPVDLAGTKQFQETCLKLYDLGVVAKRTLLDAYGFDLEQEVERRELEREKGIDKVLSDPSLINELVMEDSPTEETPQSSDVPEDNGEYGTYKRNGKTYKRKNRTKKTSDNDGDGESGRPTQDFNERQSDPYKSETGRLPKPSNPEGSEART